MSDIDTHDLTPFTHQNIMLGGEILGTALQGDRVDLADLLSPVRDVKQAWVAGFVYYQAYGAIPSDINQADIAWRLFEVTQKNLNDFFQAAVKDSFSSADPSRFDLETRMTIQRLNDAQRERAKPHELGTIKEIAAKFNVSLSEVRRRKAEGTLHELKLP